jgi:photosystem II stability/assembly factor-like uncharacterized protein
MPIFRLVIRTTILLCLTLAGFAQTWVAQPSGATASLRGISAVNDKVAWASGTGGTFLRTIDGGATWHAGVVPGAAKLDFRGIQAFSPERAILMSSGEGALSSIYGTEDAGAHWKLLFMNSDPKGFYDSIAFTDARRGMVFGDPVEGRFVILITSDGGKTWTRTGFPASPAGEGAFAASNTALVIRGPDAWVATGGIGGSRAGRLSSNGEHCCKLAQLPIRHEADAAGVFSIAFSDALHGIAVGGDYSKPAESMHNVAITNDGGITWTEPKGAHPRGYRSAVAWLPQQKIFLTTGTTGSEISRDNGQNWTAFDDSAWNALSVSPNGACWAVGPKGRIAKLAFDVPAKP